jgi:hypothetical protein
MKKVAMKKIIVLALAALTLGVPAASAANDPRVPALNTRVGTLQTRISALTTQLGTVQTRVSTLTTQLGTLQTKVDYNSAWTFCFYAKQMAVNVAMIDLVGTIIGSGSSGLVAPSDNGACATVGWGGTANATKSVGAEFSPLSSWQSIVALTGAPPLYEAK